MADPAVRVLLCDLRDCALAQDVPQPGMMRCEPMFATTASAQLPNTRWRDSLTRRPGIASR
jgi:hypothetical protein